MSLLVCYALVICNLYSRIKHLKEMQEEKRAILTQIVIFGLALVFKTFECSFYVYAYATDDDICKGKDRADGILAAMVIISLTKQYVYIWVPTFYMLVTYRRTYSREQT